MIKKTSDETSDGYFVHFGQGSEVCEQGLRTTSDSSLIMSTKTSVGGGFFRNHRTRSVRTSEAEVQSAYGMGAIVGFMDTEARNFNGSYPLAGERIGPLWRALWARLQPDSWLCGSDLAAELAPRHGVEPTTVKNLLRHAHRAGMLDSRQAVPQGHKRMAAHYRVSVDK